MPQFRATATVQHAPQVGFNDHGEKLTGAFVTVGVNVINFQDTLTMSPIRSEASASHGRVEQDIAVVKLLFPPNYAVAINDQVILFATSLEVTAVFPRANVQGRIEHQEVNLRRMEA